MSYADKRRLTDAGLLAEDEAEAAEEWRIFQEVCRSLWD